MSARASLILALVISSSCIDCKTVSSRQAVRKFPDGFIFGTATASYQVEGAWDEDGKSENIWDHLTHKEPNGVLDGSSGDIADDSYRQYKRDVEMLRELGVDMYRFSLSWTRILPTSFPDQINAAGVQYYNNLIDELLKYNIQPMITLYHWDLPQRLQDLGGWANPDIADWYADYARVAFELFGDRVKYWITMNEPQVICQYGYGFGNFAPQVGMSGRAEYMCAKNLLIAHARAYHIYDQDFRPSQGGSISITLSANWYEPETEKDTVAAEETNLIEWALYAHPIFTETGDFPPAIRQRIDAKSEEQGFFRSRLPVFTPEEVDFVKGTSDFFGLNHYTTYLVYRNESVIGSYDVPSYYDDIEAAWYQKDEWVSSIAGSTTMTRSVPWGFHKLLLNIKENYNNPQIFVTENGFATHGGLDDYDRAEYYRDYLDAMLDAMEDGCDVIGYTAWSLLDNFEWMQGYTQRFGLYEVDYESPERTRTPRKSAFVYKEIVRTRSLDPTYEPDTTEMTIDEGH